MILKNEGNYSKCKSEQEFKMKFLKNAKNKQDFYCFCIETEETVKGFPDVLCVEKNTDKASFEEFKYTKTGKIKFQPTQPSFYKRYSTLPICVVAYNAKSDKVHCFMTHELFDKESPYYMNEKSEVDLCKAEGEGIKYESAYCQFRIISKR